MLALLPLFLCQLEGLSACEPLEPCHEQALPLEAIGCDGLLGYHFDTGWIPEDDEIQLRLVAQFGGQFNEEGAAAAVTMGGGARLDWGGAAGIEAQLFGEADGGRIYAAYGIDLTITIRYDVEWEGIGVDGEVDIPIPLGGLERLNMSAEGAFAPWAFPSSVSASAEVRAASDRFTLFEYDVIGQFFDLTIDVGFDEIEVPVSGGFRLDAETFLDVAYQTQRVALEGVEPFTAEAQRHGVPSGPEGYGAALRAGVEGEGDFECVLGMTFLPTLFIEIAGHEMSIDWPIDVDLQGDEARVPLSFKAPLDIPLPDLWIRQTPTRGAPLMVENHGGAPLRLSFQGATPVGPVIVQPGDPATIQLQGQGAAQMLTNDPDQPLVMLQISGAPQPFVDGSVPVWEGDASIRDAAPPSPRPDAGPAVDPSGDDAAPSSDAAASPGAPLQPGAPRAAGGGAVTQTGGCACGMGYRARGGSLGWALLLGGLLGIRGRRCRRTDPARPRSGSSGHPGRQRRR